LDSCDFKPKPYVKFSGWPIERSDLDPFLEEAKSILDIPTTGGARQNTSLDYLTKTIANSQDFRNTEFWFSAPTTRFGQKYREELKHMPTLACYLNANLVDITLMENLSRVEQVEVRTYAGRVFKVSAQAFVLAAGGIENPRILLNCNAQIKDGIGNGTGLVGRFFNEHPHQGVGEFILEDLVKERLVKYRVNRRADWRFLAPTERFMEQEGILNFGIRLQLNSSAGLDTTSGFKEKLRKVICESELLQDSAVIVQGKKIRCPLDVTVHIASEQALNPSSRIALSSELDMFGKRRVVLDWRLSEIDRHTMQRALIRFGETFAALGIGRVRLADWLLVENADLPGPDAEGNVRWTGYGMGIGGNHHMCTTRMGKSPRDGVVDSNQRVFGIDNLYLAGSSVFSTGGHANPTFTIVQMVLRLASHLNEILIERI